MSLHWENGHWIDTATGAAVNPRDYMTGKTSQPTLEQVNKAAADFPKGQLNTTVQTMLVPEGWMLISYWISNDSTRARFQTFLEAHGLLSLELMKGSVYLGPTNEVLDKQVEDEARRVMSECKGRASVTAFPGVFGQDVARTFSDRVVTNALADLQKQEEAVTELEAFLTDGKKMFNDKGKELDPLTTGAGRLNALKDAVDAANGIMTRFSGNAALEKMAEKLSLRQRQIQAWVVKVDSTYKRYAAMERGRRKVPKGVA